MDRRQVFVMANSGGKPPTADRLRRKPMKPNSIAIILSMLSVGWSARTQASTLQSAPDKNQTASASANQEASVATGAYRPGSGTIILVQLAKPLDVRKLSV